MSILKQTKINKLLKKWPTGTVFLSSKLKENDISRQLLGRYKKTGWIESIGTGAVIRSEDIVDCYGGIYALQTQANLSVHVGGRTALSLQGKGHYLEMNPSKIILIGDKKDYLPLWFKDHDWMISIEYISTSFLPPNMGLIDLERKNFSVKISNPARALFECLHLAPKHQELFECYEFMESLGNLRPQSVQELLENCTSIKVKRLFLYLAEKCQHAWVDFLDLSRIDLGSGKRHLEKNGIYIHKYKITVPKELEKSENL
ncbi:MAG: hypothetical protein FJX18_02795 [Alphaproteobacteria bacterium]|nr:hypothetical protein [Alphaproteobacteria bacterium]